MNDENNGKTGTPRLKTGLAEMLKGGVIMDVVTADHAKIAEDAGAVAVMALERVPADIRAEGGVSRMSSIEKLREIMEVATIPVMAKCRIGHFAEAQMLQALGVDYVDESEVLTPADEHYHVDKFAFEVPFVCGCRNLGEALRRIGEGACMIRTKGEAGSGNIVEAVRHMRSVMSELRNLTTLRPEELMTTAKDLGAPYDLVRLVAETGKLPVPNFAAGGIATPADASLMMQLGAEAVFVGSGIFKSGDPAQRAKAIVEATTHYDDPEILIRVSEKLGDAMVGINIDTLDEKIWKKIDRPHQKIKFDAILEGICSFSKGFKGHLVTETMLVKDLNDDVQSLEKTAEFISKINCVQAYLSIPTRPPALKWVRPPEEQKINRAYHVFETHALNTEYLIGYEGNQFAYTGKVEADILSITSVHPMREDAVYAYLKKANKDFSIIEKMLTENKLIISTYNNEMFYLRTLRHS